MPRPASDVYSAQDIARVTGAPVADVEARLRATVAASAAMLLSGRFVNYEEAVRLAREILDERVAALSLQPTALFTGNTPAQRVGSMPLAVSGSVHGAIFGVAALIALLSVTETVPSASQLPDAMPAQLVFLIQPGPGGGGGGGGLRQPTPPPKARRKGTETLSSPIPPPPKSVEAPKALPPEPIPDYPLPPAQAPVVQSPADKDSKSGVMEERPPSESQGPGDRGGAGTGAGTGMGEGQGSGIGDGSGGGTGGGPYRPGSGIEPPSILREVKPDYTEEARRLGIRGDVVLEIVVRADGSVGHVRILQGLGHGLDQRAVDAVRQWRFAAAKRRGQPVDVIVEVAVEFQLR